MIYLLLALQAIVTGAILYLTIKLFFATRGSRLYSTASALGIVGGLSAILYLMQYFINSDLIGFLVKVSVTSFALVLYYLWRVTYNQIGKNTYHIFIWLLSLFQIACDFIVMKNFDFIVMPINLISKYQILSIIMILVITIQYFKFTKMNRTAQLDFIPLTLLMYSMSYLTSLLTVGNIAVLFTIIMYVSIVLILVFYTKDYKRSFYY